jgi:hypothetical protein
MATTTIPPRVSARVQQALTALHAWNEAIAQARRMEAVAHQPGRYEHDLRSTEAGASCRTRLAAALRTLEQCEALARVNALDPAALYAALGGKPLLAPEGPQVQEWHRAPGHSLSQGT